jgi:hypothetical protein
MNRRNACFANASLLEARIGDINILENASRVWKMNVFSWRA